MTDNTKQFLADESAADDYALYKKTGNGVLIWKIYRMYRKLDLPVPDYILDKLDVYAAGVIDGSDVLVSLELKKPDTKGGAQGAALNARQENERNIVMMCHVLRKRHNPMMAYNMTAKQFGKSVGYVKKTYSTWASSSAADAKLNKSVANLQALISRWCNK